MTAGFIPACRSNLVSIHTPTKGVTQRLQSFDIVLRFQSTHPRRVWQSGQRREDSSFTFQSTHPRRVWQHKGYEYQWRMLVSIHTPTKGVTNSHKDKLSVKRVSIHTPTKGVTSSPRTCHLGLRVSIHTPTKGVTHLSRLIIAYVLFQSTHPRRVWLKFRVNWKAVRWFQSTHPRRVWHQFFRLSAFPPWFQSTHPRRVWQDIRTIIKHSIEFQSTHPRRVWRGRPR